MTATKAILAGGCFWGMEELFRAQPGVTATRVGYAGGKTDNPTYNDIKTGRTGHAETLELTYDPAKTSFRRILEFFFQVHDPSTPDRQGNDRGTQYRSVIFAQDDEQADIARETIKDADASGKWPGKIVTEIVLDAPFYEAEDFHQNYLQRLPNGYTCHWVRPTWTL